MLPEARRWSDWPAWPQVSSLACLALSTWGTHPRRLVAAASRQHRAHGTASHRGGVLKRSDGGAVAADGGREAHAVHRSFTRRLATAISLDARSLEVTDAVFWLDLELGEVEAAELANLLAERVPRLARTLTLELPGGVVADTATLVAALTPPPPPCSDVTAAPALLLSIDRGTAADVALSPSVMLGGLEFRLAAVVTAVAGSPGFFCDVRCSDGAAVPGGGGAGGEGGDSWVRFQPASVSPPRWRPRGCAPRSAPPLWGRWGARNLHRRRGGWTTATPPAAARCGWGWREACGWCRHRVPRASSGGQRRCSPACRRRRGVSSAGVRRRGGVRGDLSLSTLSLRGGVVLHHHRCGHRRAVRPTGESRRPHHPDPLPLGLRRAHGRGTHPLARRAAPRPGVQWRLERFRA